MTYHLLTALIAFAFVTSITPGPNNLMLMASGANFGVRRSIPHMSGVALGFVFMLILIGLGLAKLFDIYPASHTILKVASIIYLSFLAWKIATAAPPDDTTENKSPMTFVQAAMFQWVNPKAWTMALTAVTAYAPSQTFTATLLVAAVFGAINWPCVGFWTVLGQQMRKVLTSRKRLRAFNIFMAVLLLASLYPVLGSVTDMT